MEVEFELPECGDEEIKEVADVLKRGRLTTASGFAKFEEDFARFAGVPAKVIGNREHGTFPDI